jgi:uncharacterized membrane protein YqjE
MARDPSRFDRPDQTLGTMIGELVGNMQDLIRGEVSLAKQEIKEEATAAGVGAGFMAGAGAMGLVCAFFVGLTLTYALTNLVPNWAAALIVAALFALVGFVLFTMGKSRLQHVNPVPRQTIESLKEDAEWVKQQVSSDGNSTTSATS